MIDPVFCDRCGTEIPSGWPVSQYHTEDGWVVMHRFSTQCDPAGVEFVDSLKHKFEAFKHDPAD